MMLRAEFVISLLSPAGTDLDGACSCKENGCCLIYLSVAPYQSQHEDTNRNRSRGDGCRRYVGLTPRC